MKYQIIGKNIEVTEAIRNKIIKKLSDFDKYLIISDDQECRVVVSVAPNSQKIEVTIPTKVALLRSEVKHEDLYAAIDLVVDKLEDQMRRVKTKLDRTHNEKLSRALVWDKVENDPEDDVVFVRTKNIALEEYDLDEAIAKMELLGHSFFIYKDIDDKKIAVVYKRFEGGYGVILVD